MDEEKLEANRHRAYREKQKQLECSLREYADEMEFNVETRNEQNVQLQNHVIELEAKNSALTEKNCLLEMNENNLLTILASRELILVTTHAPSSAASKSLDCVSEKGTQTTEMDDSHINKMLEQENISLKQENILLKQENEKLKKENMIMRQLGMIIAQTSFEEENKASFVQENEQSTQSSSVENENAEPESDNPFGPVEFLDRQVDRTQLLQTDSTNQDFDPPEVDGWNYSQMFGQDEVAPQTNNPGASFCGNPVPKDTTTDSTAMRQEPGYQVHDEMEIS